jgi:hypothetical protein
MLLLVCTVGLVACRKPKPVEVLKTPEEVRAKMEKDREAPARKAPRKDKPVAQTRRATPPPARTPSPTPTPMVDYSPVVIQATGMMTETGSPEPEGGWNMSANGALQIDNFDVPYPVKQVVLEMKGNSAVGIWPEVDLNMYNRTEKKNFFPWPRDYVTTSGYHLYTKDVNPALPPGKYLVTFRYYNDRVPQGSTEDRSICIRKIELNP